MKNYKKIGFTRQKGFYSTHMPQHGKGVDIFYQGNRKYKKNFANLASDLVKKLPEIAGKFGTPSVRQYYKGTNFREKKLEFEKISSLSILKILKEFKTNKATEVDNLAGWFLKDGSDILCTPVAKICNLSIKLASFPDKWKVAKINPLYKKGLKTDPKNFRPTSLLPLISKIIERIIHDQTMNFLSDNNVLTISIRF